MPRPDTWANDKKISGERPQEAAHLTPQWLYSPLQRLTNLHSQKCWLSNASATPALPPSVTTFHLFLSFWRVIIWTSWIHERIHALPRPPSCNVSIKAFFSFQQFAWKTNANISITPSIKKYSIRSLKSHLVSHLTPHTLTFLAITFTPSSNASQRLAFISVTPEVAWSFVSLEVARILWQHSVWDTVQSSEPIFLNLCVT